MIIRSWCGRAAPGKQHRYIEHFTTNVLPQLQTLSGFLGAILLKETRFNEVEFLVLTRWASMDAIRQFAGNDISKAVVEPEAVAALLDFDRVVHHYEVVMETTA
jgi:heme-degrading monooxygenase HmoA